MTEDVSDKSSQLNIDDKVLGSDGSLIQRLYNGANVEDPFDVFNSASHEELDQLVKKFPARTLELFSDNSLPPKLLVTSINTETSLLYLKLLASLIKRNDGNDVDYYLKLVSSLVNEFEYQVKDLNPIISVIVPHFSSSDLVQVILVELYAVYKEQIIPPLKDSVELLSVNGEVITCCQLLVLLFQLNAKSAVDIFQLDSVQLMLYDAGSSHSTKIIENGLNLLSTACVDEPTRNAIFSKYLDQLIQGTNQTDINIKTLAALVIVKTWNFQALDTNQKISLEDLTNIFIANLNSHSIEGLAYLSMKKSIRSHLRKDGEFVIELVQKLETPGSDLYGILLIIGNLTALEEEEETSQLKRHAQKGLDEEIEESQDDIFEFMDDLVELSIVSKFCSHSKISKQCMEQGMKIFYNLSKNKANHEQLVKQGALIRIMEFIGRETEVTDYKLMAFKALSMILTTSDPHLVFGPNASLKTAVNYLFQFLAMDNISLRDQFQILLSLTNLSVIDHGPLTSEQWDELDDELVQTDYPMVKTSILELISNLMQHRSNLPALFNWANPKNKKRYDLIVKMTRLPDVKAQCSAISSLSFGVTFQLIGEELLKDKPLRDNLLQVLNEQPKERELVERAAFVFYYLLFYADVTENKTIFTDKKTIIDTLDRAIGACHNEEALEMLKECKSLVSNL